MRMPLLLITMLLLSSAMAQQPPIYTPIRSDVEPQLRNGRTFVPLRVISEQLDARVDWQPVNRTVMIQRPQQPTITLTIGAAAALVNGRTITLDAAPFIIQGRTMVPLRFIAEQYGVPVAYDTPTRSVRLYRADRVYILPFPDTRSGIVIAYPTRGQLVRNPILVQGQANVFEGALIIEVQDTHGGVITRTYATAGMGAFYPFSMKVFYNQPGEDAIDGRIVVYAQDASGNGKILARDSVDVRLASTQ